MVDSKFEMMCKESNDRKRAMRVKAHILQNGDSSYEGECECIVDEKVIIVGAGPSGLATALCLKKEGVDQGVVVLEKSECIASLWRERTYDRLCLHVPKQLSELPHMHFAKEVPKFPTRRQFLDYLDAYARTGGIHPHFNESVLHASFDEQSGLWHVRTESGGRAAASDSSGEPNAQGARTCSASKQEGSGVIGGGVGGLIRRTKIYRAPWLVVATGENAEPVLPAASSSSAAASACCLPDLHRFSGQILHSCQYKNGRSFRSQRVLVVGCGNSGMEVSLDLVNHGAMPSVSVRSPVHVLPREIYGISTFSIAMALSKFLTLRWTDRLLLLLSRLVLGDPSSYGFKRPSSGPLELKETLGKTPLLDVGTFTKIKDGSIQVVPAVQKFTPSGCFFKDGSYAEFDAVILATGYQSNVPSWLKVEAKCVNEACQGQWKSKDGMYFAGFNRKGLLGISMDARRIGADISQQYHTP